MRHSSAQKIMDSFFFFMRDCCQICQENQDIPAGLFRQLFLSTTIFLFFPLTLAILSISSASFVVKVSSHLMMGRESRGSRKRIKRSTSSHWMPGVPSSLRG